MKGYCPRSPGDGRSRLGAIFGSKSHTPPQAPRAGRSPRASMPTSPCFPSKARCQPAREGSVLVRDDWNRGPSKGMITRSLVVIGVREGNPLSIRDWPDLARREVSVLYPDPKTSGGARWNINAIYGAGLLKDRKRPDPRARASCSRLCRSGW